MDSYKLRFVPLGGILDVTRNMYVYELYKNDSLQDILVVDCGIGFPKEVELGVDYVIPDISYLKDKIDKIRAILLTHGHEDHISGLRFHYKPLGSPPVFTAKLTSLLLKEKLKEYNVSARVNQIEYHRDYTFGGFRARFIHVTHSIPDTTHILITTPVGNFYHGADFKLDLTPPYGDPPDFQEIVRVKGQGVLCLFSDCLGAEREGLTLSESIVGETFEDEMRSTKGKFIMTTFSSNISRIRQCVEAAVKFNRSISFLGRSMKTGAAISNQIGYLPIPKRFLVDERRCSSLPPNKLCIIAAGSQGQFDSALSKIANNQNKSVKIKPGDKVFFSSDPIPGQEESVYDLIEQLYRAGAQVVYSDIAERLHASGHGNQEDLKLLMRLVSPTYLAPIGGTVRHQRQYLELCRELGYRDDHVYLLDEGQTLVFEKGKASLGATVETKSIYVDAYGVGDVGNIVLRDRKALSTEGIVFAALVVDSSFGLVTVELSSRGFVFQDDESGIFEGARAIIAKIAKPQQGARLTSTGIKREVGRDLEGYFAKKTGRKPLIVVEVIQV